MSKYDVEKHEDAKDANGWMYDNNGQRFSEYDSTDRRVSVVDDVFGEIKEGGPNYRDASSSL